MGISIVFVEHYRPAARWPENLRTIICRLRLAAGQTTQIYHEKQRKHEKNTDKKATENVTHKMCFFSRLGSENEKRFGGGQGREAVRLADWSINYSLSLSKVRFFWLYNQNLRFHTPKGKQERAKNANAGESSWEFEMESELEPESESQ